MRGNLLLKFIIPLCLWTALLSGAGSDSSPTTLPTIAPTTNAATTEAGGKLAPATCGKIARVHALDGVYLASQPSAADLAQAKKDGIKTVMNLRPDAENTAFDERRVVESAGLAYVHIPFAGADDLTDDVFDKTREQLKAARRPILLHCASANRVGAVWAPHRMLDAGLSWDAALAEAKTIGLRTPALEAKAKDYIERRGK